MKIKTKQIKQRIKRIVPLLLLGTLIFSGFAGCTPKLPESDSSVQGELEPQITLSGQASEESIPSESETEESKPTANPEGDIYILATSDVHCGFNMNYGYAGLYEIRKRLEDEGNTVFLVDDGDSLWGEYVGLVTGGEAAIDLMNKMRYDIAVPGNHEFEYGGDGFMALAEKAKFKYICCNFTMNGKVVFDPYVIKQAGDKKIAFVGVTTPLAKTYYAIPYYFLDEKGNDKYGFMEDSNGKAVYDAVQQSVDKARSEGADYVIVMGHMGYKSEYKPYSYSDVISHINGIDFFLDGHSHDAKELSAKDKDGRKVTRIGIGKKMSRIGYVKINAKTGKISTGLYEWSDPRCADDIFGFRNEMTSAVNDEIGTMYAKLESEVGRTGVKLARTTDKAGVTVSTRSTETNLGDLIADAYRAEMKTDIGFVSGGTIMESIKPGSITYGTLLNTLPFGRRICAAEVTGQQIIDALEFGAENYPKANDEFVQVSGLTYEIDTSVKSGLKKTGYGRFKSIKGDYRVKNVMVGDKPIDPEQTYTLAATNYMLCPSKYMKGNYIDSGFAMFDGCKIIKQGMNYDYQTVADYIINKQQGKVNDKYSKPLGQGRIKEYKPVD